MLFYTSWVKDSFSIFCFDNLFLSLWLLWHLMCLPSFFDCVSRWKKHYILKGVTDALFLYFETTAFEYRAKTNAGVTATEVLYILSVSVLRGLCVLNAHFTGVYILQRGCFFTLSVSCMAVVGREVNGHEWSTHVFLYVVMTMVRNVRIGALRNSKG